MSQLLKSLQEAERERRDKGGGARTPAEGDSRPAVHEPGYFLVSLLLLALVCGAIVGGYLLLRDAFPAIP